MARRTTTRPAKAERASRPQPMAEAQSRRGGLRLIEGAGLGVAGIRAGDLRQAAERAAGLAAGPAGSEERSGYSRNVQPRTPGQKRLVQAIASHPLTLALGPAGTGKTYLAVAAAVAALDAGKVERVVLSRPAVEAGESLGYLPGDLTDKMAPYLRPLFDALADRMGMKRLKSSLADGSVEIAPVAYMRGRTLNNCFVVIDEAQNCTYGQLKMLLTRLGWHATMVVTGDPAQSDLLDGLSGLSEVAARLDGLEQAGVVRLHETDIVRHPLVAAMLQVL